MSKDEEKMLKIAKSKGCYGGGAWNILCVLRSLYNAGFRDVGELRKWLDERMERLNDKNSTITNTEYLAFKEALDRLESL